MFRFKTTIIRELDICALLNL